MFADLKKNIKISAAAIPAATQLFTPDWIVRYMVENSLGRLWTEGHGKPENADWQYYLEEAEQEDSVKAELEKLRAEYKSIQPEQIKVIDPCMGSGHILVYAFDVLMDIYTSCGWSERDAALSILQHNLYGLDIDRRAYQLAYFAVMMKARQYNRSVIRNGDVQPQLANFADVMGVDTSFTSGKIREFAEQFKFADTYGSLMEITAPDGLDEAVSEFNVSFGMSRKQLDMMLRINKNLSQKYDIVVTNPPYMGGSGMNARLSDFVKNNFADYKSDLFSAFMVKIFDWCKPNGQIGLVTPYVWMFIQSYEKLRQLVYASMSITSMIQLEYNAFESACVPVATFTLCKSEIKTSGEYIKLSDFKGIENQEPKALEAINNPKCGYRYTAKQENFSKIPGMPVAYWVSEAFVRAFGYKKIGNIGNPRQGIIPGNVNVFVRLWFEPNIKKIGFHHKEHGDICKYGYKWFPYNKGRAFRRWYGNIEHLINMENDGYDIKYSGENNNYRLREPELYFQEAVTWSKVSSGAFSARFMPSGNLFDIAGCCVFDLGNNLNYVLGLTNSIIVTKFLDLISPTMNYEVDHIKKLPVIFDESKREKLDSIVNENISISKEEWDSFETSWDFEQHPLI